MEELEDEEDGVDPFSCYAADVQYTENADAEGYAAQRSLIAGMSAATSKGKQWENYETVFTNAKAGMAGVDRERVKQVVFEMSKDSAHFKNERRKQIKTDERIARLLARAKQLSAPEIDGFTRQMDKKLAALKSSVDLTRTWCHVDMDAFYAAVEELHDPSLKSKPMAVGGIGMICTANYEARKYGVRAAMPGFIARELCPQLLFAKPDFQKYVKAAKATRLIFQDFDPDFSCGSLDEAYLDLTDYCAAHGLTGSEVAQTIRTRVYAATQLTCSCGVAPNRLLAKICSDINKPNGQTVLLPDAAAIKKFIDELPVRKVPNIGKVAEQTLKALGVTKCSDLTASRGLLGALYSGIATDHFMAVSLGIGGTRHSDPVKEGEAGRKGMSCERTFRAISSRSDLEAKCAELAEKLSADLAEDGLKGRTLTLKLKSTNFEVRTRAATLPQAVSSFEAIHAAGLRLLHPELPIEIRLMGLRMSNFLEIVREPGQRSISAFVHGPPPSDQPGHAAHEPSGDGNAADASGSQHLELSLRDWAPTAGAGTSQGSQPVEISLRDWNDPAQSQHLPSHADQHRQQQQADREESPSEAGIGIDDSAGGASPLGRQRPRTWDCKLCTYAGNQLKWLRCEVCDSLRGSTLHTAVRQRQSCHPAAPAAPLERSDSQQGSSCNQSKRDASPAEDAEEGPAAQRESSDEQNGSELAVHGPTAGVQQGKSGNAVARGAGTKSKRGTRAPTGVSHSQHTGTRTLESFMKRARHE